MPNKRRRELKSYDFAYGRLFVGDTPAQVALAVKAFEEENGINRG
jgi:hypothetical protein